MRREWPWTVEQARAWRRTLQIRRFRGDFCLDWGHGTFEPLYGRDRARWTTGFERWRRPSARSIIQQTDFQFDRHWDFTETGAVDP